MSDERNKPKRFFKSHIFRIVVFAVVLISTVLFPMLFAYPNGNLTVKCLVIVTVVLCSIAETVVFAVVTHKCVYKKLRKASNDLCLMARDGMLKTVDENSLDNTVSTALAAVNITSAEYARLEQVRKSFVSNASHELRSPLTSVQGFLQAVLDGTVSKDDSERYLKIAFNETKRLNSLITSMLDLSRLDSGKNPLILTKFNINDAITDIVAKFEPALVKKSVQLNMDFASPTCYVYADKDKIIQVITNLVDNAIKYSPAYSRIIVMTSVHENKAYITVRDFGYGISKRDQMLIWDRFYMTDKSRSPIKSKGSGLGLSIVKKIIDEHNEVIWCESGRGQGAKFIFTLTLFNPAKHKISTGKVIKIPEDPAIAVDQQGTTVK